MVFIYCIFSMYQVKLIIKYNKFRYSWVILNSHNTSLIQAWSLDLLISFERYPIGTNALTTAKVLINWDMFVSRQPMMDCIIMTINSYKKHSPDASSITWPIDFILKRYHIGTNTPYCCESPHWLTRGYVSSTIDRQTVLLCLC